MFVCLCRGVCDREVRAAIVGGAKSCDEVGDACGAGTGCGACRPMIRNMLDQAKGELYRTARPPAVGGAAVSDIR
jgi:bacterioferritin-associated ferredoxin